MSIKANTMILNNRCEFFFANENAWCPMGACGTGELASWLDACGGDVLVARFNTSPKHLVADLRKFNRRFANLAGWVKSEFAPMVVRGIVVGGVYTCELRRS